MKIDKAADAECKKVLMGLEDFYFTAGVVSAKLGKESSTTEAVEVREEMVALQTKMVEAEYLPAKRMPALLLKAYRSGLRMT